MDRAFIVDYYRAMAKVLLPHLRRRPISFKRYVDDIEGESFWEKDAPSFTPSWVKRVAVPRREGGPPIDYIVVDNSKTLTWLASVGAVEIHPFLHKAPRLEIATHVVFDLDPGEGATFRQCARVAVLLREVLQRIDLHSFAKVSGSKGIQVYVPLNANATHEMTEAFARLIADEMARRHPKLIVSKMKKVLRRKKIFIDWSQNADYKTTVAVYSLRATGFVSMPVTWQELESGKTLRFAPDEAIARVRKLGDLFAPVETMKQRLGDGSLSASKPSARRRATYAEPRVRRTQSSRRLYLITKTEMGSELWLDIGGKFRRFILRPDREGDAQLIAMPAGEFPIDAAYYRAEVPKEWKGRVTIEDDGVYEIVEGSWERQHFRLWFRGRALSGQWTLQKIEPGPKHRSWRLVPDVPSPYK